MLQIIPLIIQGLQLANSIAAALKKRGIETANNKKINDRLREKLKKAENDIVNELENEFGPGADDRFR